MVVPTELPLVGPNARVGRERGHSSLQVWQTWQGKGHSKGYFQKRCGECKGKAKVRNHPHDGCPRFMLQDTEANWSCLI